MNFPRINNVTVKTLFCKPNLTDYAIKSNQIKGVDVNKKCKTGKILVGIIVVDTHKIKLMIGDEKFRLFRLVIQIHFTSVAKKKNLFNPDT